MFAVACQVGGQALNLLVLKSEANKLSDLSVVKGSELKRLTTIPDNKYQSDYLNADFRIQANRTIYSTNFLQPQLRFLCLRIVVS